MGVSSAIDGVRVLLAMDDGVGSSPRLVVSLVYSIDEWVSAVGTCWRVMGLLFELHAMVVRWAINAFAFIFRCMRFFQLLVDGSRPSEFVVRRRSLLVLGRVLRVELVSTVPNRPCLSWGCVVASPL